MSVERVVRKDGSAVWRVRWRQAGRNRSKVLGRKRDADAFDAEIVRRKRTGELARLDAGKELLADFGEEWWRLHAEPNLARSTRTAKAACALQSRASATRSNPTLASSMPPSQRFRRRSAMRSRASAATSTSASASSSTLACTRPPPAPRSGSRSRLRQPTAASSTSDFATCSSASSSGRVLELVDHVNRTCQRQLRIVTHPARHVDHRPALVQQARAERMPQRARRRLRLTGRRRRERGEADDA